MNNTTTTNTTDTNVYVCPFCGSTESVSKGFYKDTGKIRRCKNCNKQFRGTWGDGTLATVAPNPTQTAVAPRETVQESVTLAGADDDKREYRMRLNGNETSFPSWKVFKLILEAYGDKVTVDPNDDRLYIITPETGSKNVDIFKDIIIKIGGTVEVDLHDDHYFVVTPK